MTSTVNDDPLDPSAAERLSMLASIGTYGPDELQKLLFFRQLSDFEQDDVQRLLNKLNAMGLQKVRDDSLHVLLCVLHDAYAADRHKFLRNVFFPWVGLSKDLIAHQQRIGRELSRIADFQSGSVEDATHITNVYRSIVSDLTDPYLTLVVACFQFIEGSFRSLTEADLGQGERNKHEYLNARISKLAPSCDSFLAGYNAVARNAMSHTGSRGVSYLSDEVVFRSISRGSPPTAVVVKWSYDELLANTLRLMEGVTSIGIAVELFGFDTAHTVNEEIDTILSFLHYLSTPEQRRSLRSDAQKILTKIRTDGNLSDSEKLRALSNLLVDAYAQRGMSVSDICADQDRIVVRGQGQPLDTSDDQALIERMMTLVRYAIVATPFFGTDWEWIETREQLSSDGPQLQGIFASSDLLAYEDESAGLIDLLNDGA